MKVVAYSLLLYQKMSSITDSFDIFAEFFVSLFLQSIFKGPLLVLCQTDFLPWARDYIFEFEHVKGNRNIANDRTGVVIGTFERRNCLWLK